MNQGKLEIVTLNDDEPFLRQKSRNITQEELVSDKIQQLINAMKNYLLDAQNNAVGLSAIQIGQPIAMFLFKDFGQGKSPIIRVAVNPQVLPACDLLKEGKEACLSVPGVDGVVARYQSVKMKFLDEKGDKCSKKFEDYTARIIQHEYDHLQGVLFTDKVLSRH